MIVLYRMLVTGCLLTLKLCKGSEGSNAGHIAIIRTCPHVAERREVGLGTVLAHIAVEHWG